MRKLPRSFYSRDTVTVAKELLGTHLIHQVRGRDLVGRIVEVEAYLGPHDLAAHSSKGMTDRTKVMFGPPGHAYVYLIYGMHHCMNVVTEPEGNGAAVLIRALEPIQNVTQRTQGPGLLCRAMEITRSRNAHDLLSEDFFISRTGTRNDHIVVRRSRIGVHYSGRWARRLLRFYIKDNPFVSRP